MDKKIVLTAYFLLVALAEVISVEEVDKNQEDAGYRFNSDNYKPAQSDISATCTAELRNRQKRGCLEVKTGGATYVRWGRTVCHAGVETVYSGIASGSKYDLGGGTDQTLCLPISHDPSYHPDDTLKSHMGTLWGIRYEVYTSTASVPLNKRSGLQVPCAVCYVERSAILTIPALNSCPDGWTLEYDGYLMSEYTTPNRPRKDTICVDGMGESATPYAEYPSVIYLMNVHCDAGLPCPPYAADKPLTCAVCSK